MIKKTIKKQAKVIKK